MGINLLIKSIDLHVFIPALSSLWGGKNDVVLLTSPTQESQGVVLLSSPLISERASC